MAIQIANEKFERSGTRDQNRNYTYTREFQLITDIPTRGAGTILDYVQANIATWGDAFEEDINGAADYTDPNSVLVDIKVRQANRDDLNDWSATLTYVGIEDPTVVPAEIDTDGVRWQKYLTEDYHDVSVQNSAGDPYPDGLKADRTRYNITIVKNVLEYSPQIADDFTDSINMLPLFVNPDQGLLPGWPVNGFPIGTVKLGSMTAKRLQRTNQKTFYWRRKVFLEIDMNGWNVLYRDQGYRELDKNGNRDYSKNKATGIVQNVIHLLDGTGHFVPPGGVPVIFPATGFVPYADDLDWSPLQIENI